MGVLGEIEKFFEKPVVYSNGKVTLLADFLAQDNKDFTLKDLYCFYKEFGLFFDEQGRAAYHFNRTQQAIFVLNRGAVVNRYKNAQKREQEAIGKGIAFKNNEAWRRYWELAQQMTTK